MAGIAGIGFTVSIFVAGLAFDDPALTDQATIGVLAASCSPPSSAATILLTNAHARQSTATPRMADRR